MGNEVEGVHLDDNYKNTVNDMKYINKKGQSLLEHDTTAFDIKPQIKWRKNLLDSLKTQAKKRKISKKDEIIADLEDIIRSIRTANFVKAVTIFNSFASAKFQGKSLIKQQTFATKIMNQHKTDKVKIQIDPRHYIGQLLDSTSTESIHSNEGSLSKSITPSKNKQTIKRELQKTLAKEINQQYHPVKSIKNSFIMLLKMKYRTQLDEKSPITKQQIEQILDNIHNDIDFYCCFVASGCQIYKDWIIQHGGIKQTRYFDFTKRIVRRSLFNGSSFSQQIFPLIKQICSKQILKLVKKLPSQIDVSKFQIKQQLAIEGAYMNSIMTLSDFDRIQSPNVSMQKLQIIKTQICYDIDQYHKIFGSSKNYKIDGDNLLSIICFLLCRMKPKMIDIYTQISMLKVLFGNDINKQFDETSYLLTTFFTAFEFLTDDKFLNSL